MMEPLQRTGIASDVRWAGRFSFAESLNWRLSEEEMTLIPTAENWNSFPKSSKVVYPMADDFLVYREKGTCG
jgi:hypothetical protein